MHVDKTLSDFYDGVMSVLHYAGDCKAIVFHVHAAHGTFKAALQLGDPECESVSGGRDQKHADDVRLHEPVLIQRVFIVAERLLRCHLVRKNVSFMLRSSVNVTVLVSKSLSICVILCPEWNRISTGGLL